MKQLIILWLASAIVARGQVLYFDNFEQFSNGTGVPDGYSYSPASGPAGATNTIYKLATTTVTMTNLAGSMRVEFNCPPSTVSTHWNEYQAYFPPQNNPVLMVTWQLRIEAVKPGTLGLAAVLLPIVGNDDSTVIAFNDGGEIFAVTNVFTAVSDLKTIGSWSNLAATVMTNQLLLDYPARTMTLSVNGAVVASQPLRPDLASSVDRVVFEFDEHPAYGSTGNKFALDNVKVESINPTNHYAPASISGYTVALAITNVNGTPIPPVFATNIYGVSTFSQIGPNADNTYSGNYTYVKTGTNTGTILISKTAPPDQAGETTTNFLVFSSSLSGTFAHHYDFIDTPPTVQYGTFQVVQTNSIPPIDYTYTTNNGAITITGFIGSGGSIAVPSNINGFPVTIIGANAFANKSTLTSVTIPNSVASIGIAAFMWCSGLTNVMIGNSVTIIGSQAFWRCSGLTSVMIPSSVTNIGDYAFVYCSGLTNIAVDAANPNYVGAAGVLFNKTMTTLIQFPGGLIGSYAIPATTTSISKYAFAFGPGPTSVSIGSNVTSIANQAFVGSYGLTNIAVVAANPNYASAGGVLFDKTKTALIQFPGGMTGSYIIPAAVASVGITAFYGCSGLTNVTIPDGVTSIGDSAFVFCNGLKIVKIPDSVTNMGNGVFQFCPSLHQAFFQGNAPSVNGAAGSADNTVFQGQSGAVYYLPSTTGWGATFGGWPTASWNPTAQIGGPNFGIETNRFGFNITGTANIPIVVEASTNLTGSAWVPLLTGTLTNGGIYFGDPQWTNYPSRFYRIRSP